MKLQITTPTGQIFDQHVDMVTLPGREGDLGILPNHVPLITLLGQGEVICHHGKEETRFLVTGGCAEITGDRVAILTVFAIEETAIDEGKAEEARARAEERLKERDKLSPEEITLVEASMAHSLAQLKFKRHRH